MWGERRRFDAMRGIFSMDLTDINTWLVLAIVVLVAVVEYWSYKLQGMARDDRQREIDRLVEDNRRYRDFFEQMLVKSRMGKSPRSKDRKTKRE